jgi:oligosaccharide repeat unit polymerase
MCLAMGFLTGQRSVSLMPIATALVCYMSAYRPRQVLIPLLAAPALIVVSMMAYSIRTGAAIEPDRFWNYVVAQMCFGNQFSDLRDFAWILSRFNGEWLMGKTYVAGYTPFLPSVLSPFRTEFGWGRWSSAIAGLDPTHHGGLRAGIFGEIYFNFGLVGFLVICPIVGWITGSIFANGTAFMRNKPKQSICASAVIVYTLAQLVLDVIFTTSFYQALVILIVVIFVGALQQIGQRGRGPRVVKVSYGRNQTGRDVRAPRIARRSNPGESA